jgi:FtsH-binding integral membrane protein
LRYSGNEIICINKEKRGITMDYSSNKSYMLTQGLLARIYGFMALALSITASVALYVFHQPEILEFILTHRWVVIGLFIVQIALVMTLSAALFRLSYGAALSMFFAYAALVGITFSTLFLVYTFSSIYTTFFVTSGMFAALALYGYATKADLTGIGNYAFMGLIGLIIGFIVNMFLGNGLFDYILTLCGVVIFSVLTAYDVQKLKHLASTLYNHNEMANKIAILGALTLYLDFINLFLMLLRLMGRRNNK